MAESSVVAVKGDLSHRTTEHEQTDIRRTRRIHPSTKERTEAIRGAVRCEAVQMNHPQGRVQVIGSGYHSAQQIKTFQSDHRVNKQIKPFTEG